MARTQATRAEARSYPAVSRASTLVSFAMVKRAPAKPPPSWAASGSSGQKIRKLTGILLWGRWWWGPWI